MESYRDAFELLVGYLEDHLGKKPSALSIADLDAPVVLDFLDLETVRHNSARTRNARLAAIRSFMRYVAVRDPASLPITARVLAIPAKRFDRPVLGYPTREQVTAILAAPDRATWSGRRDAVLLAVAYNTGARVPELTALQVRDVLLENQSALQLHGKGRKQRGNSTRCPVSQTPPPRGPRKHGDRTPYPYVPAFQSLIKRCLTSWKQASWLIGRTRESKSRMSEIQHEVAHRLPFGRLRQTGHRWP